MATASANQDLDMQSQNNYLKIVNHYTGCFEKFGETNKGVDWPNMQDLEKRFRVMLDITKYQTPENKIELLDLGCGFGLLLNFIKENRLEEKFKYNGAELSEPMIQAAKKKWPAENFFMRDIIKDPFQKDAYDYILMNGLLTEKLDLEFDEMFTYSKNLIKSAFNSCKIGIAFNVMSHHVDWQRSDLFHMPFDIMAEFLTKECSRNFIIRADYGLYEYTIYLFKSAND